MDRELAILHCRLNEKEDTSVLEDLEIEVLLRSSFFCNEKLRYDFNVTQHRRDLEMLRINITMELEQDKEMAHNNCQSVCYYFENKLFLNFITIF
jgi:hypothetical protein